MCREEAAEISSLRPQLDELGVTLYAVVKENIQTELEAFQPYFKGEIFLDVNKHFYGPRQRVLGLMGLVRLSVWRNLFRAWRKGFSGNNDGEGFILGGVFVFGPGEQGVLLEHQEKEFGDRVDIQSLLDAVGQIKPRNETKSES